MSLRARHAEVTRRTVLDTARRLFAERGYAGTTIAQLAEEAGVAIQTIYTSVGSKPAVAEALVDAIDEEAGVPALGKRMGEATSGTEVLALAVRLTRQLQERGGDVIAMLHAGAAVEPDLANTLAEGLRRHRMGAERVGGKLSALGALRVGCPPERAADAVDLLTSHQTYMKLTRECGWSFDACEEWIGATLTTLLLSPRS